MSTVPSQHPAVVLRSNYQHLRALLAIAIIAIIGLTVAVVVLASSSGGTTIANPAPRANHSAVHANPSAETGAKLDHRGLKLSVPQVLNGTDYPGHY